MKRKFDFYMKHLSWCGFAKPSLLDFLCVSVYFCEIYIGDILHGYKILKNNIHSYCFTTYIKTSDTIKIVYMHYFLLFIR